MPAAVEEPIITMVAESGLEVTGLPGVEGLVPGSLISAFSLLPHAKKRVASTKQLYR